MYKTSFSFSWLLAILAVSALIAIEAWAQQVTPAICQQLTTGVVDLGDEEDIPDPTLGVTEKEKKLLKIIDNLEVCKKYYEGVLAVQRDLQQLYAPKEERSNPLLGKVKKQQFNQILKENLLIMRGEISRASELQSEYLSLPQTIPAPPSVLADNIRILEDADAGFLIDFDGDIVRLKLGESYKGGVLAIKQDGLYWGEIRLE